ncbi:MAG: pantoate--beta-alanine ligase [Eubacteriales bacterium]|nr:pantoate--beta-alanine ligase [Eubacteriales bacterium]
MVTLNKIHEVRNEIRKYKRQNKTIGFVPTMGFLHEGHLSLIRQAAAENDVVVISIFVNPIQFGPSEDFEKYPRDIERDTALAEICGTDIIFAPDPAEMYPEGFTSYVDVGEKLTGVLCGKSRPGHFRGVTTVLCKLFNIVAPNRAYFGRKDAQQAVVVSKMVKDLNFDMEIVVCPIVRETDGLAMSSRNAYLTPEQRSKALALNASLEAVRQMAKTGERDAGKIREKVRQQILENARRQAPEQDTSLISKDGREDIETEIEYIETVDSESLEKVTEIKGGELLAVAVKFGKTRLIDNTTLEV